MTNAAFVMLGVDYSQRSYIHHSGIDAYLYSPGVRPTIEPLCNYIRCFLG